MNHLDYFASAERPVETCVLGSGGFGRSFLAQVLRVPLMRARIAVDMDADIAAAAFLAVGVPTTEVARCFTAD
jgi:predicted homoserine dehydrogenase-like protein